MNNYENYEALGLYGNEPSEEQIDLEEMLLDRYTDETPEINLDHELAGGLVEPSY